MMAACVVQKSRQLWTGSKVHSSKILGILVGTLTLGLAAPAYAQACNPVEAAKLLAADGGSIGQFGWSVSIDGDTAIIGARISNGSSCTGSAYIFTRSGGAGGVWTQQAKLLPDNGGACEKFSGGVGVQVSISGDTAIVGARSGRDNNGIITGVAYIFTRSGSTWTQQAKIFPPNGLRHTNFGHAVFISGDTAVIGATFDSEIDTNAGSAYVFTRSGGVGGVWTHQAKLLAADGATGDQFGFSVSISGNTVVVGASTDDDNGINSGSAYIFTESGGVWTQQAKLLPSVGVQNATFGWSVSIDGDTALIGERRSGNGGAAYIFTRSGGVGGVWTEQAKLNASEMTNGKEFGHSVSLSGDTAVIGAWRDNNENGPESGSAYVFKRSGGVGGVWTERAKLLASDGAANDRFGASVSISGNTAFIGANADDDLGNDSGSAYVYDIICTCQADLNGDGALDVLDFFAFITLFAASDLAADMNNDGNIDVLDFFAFITFFAAGCP